MEQVRDESLFLERPFIASERSYEGWWASGLRFLLGGLLLFVPQPSQADDGVSFQDIAAIEGTGLVYGRVPSTRNDIFEQIKDAGNLSFLTSGSVPNKPWGAPGVAMFDFDGDSDLDLYVTNGPGAGNSLFVNQLVETSSLTFVDSAAAAGVGAVDQDSSGVCYGDIDNDGDEDLLVLGSVDQNRLFENNRDGTFNDISVSSGLGIEIRSSTSCSFGDVDGDGLLDVAIANCCTTMDDSFALFVDPFLFNQHNQLFLNTGGNTFVDISSTSGIHDLQLPPFEGLPTLTWAIAMVDYDLDGDVDILHADDQGGIPPAELGGVDRGTLHLLQNDGTGHFTDITVESQLNRTGGWMGLSFGDINGDGNLDLFATNLGDYVRTIVTPLDPVYGDFARYTVGEIASRWFLGSSRGVFSDPGVGPLVATPFGWGTSMVDYNNDGDTDVIFYGGLDAGPFVLLSQPAILQNDGKGQFSQDHNALTDSTDHTRRVVHGVAVGDLDNNGYIDIVTVSSVDAPESTPTRPFRHEWGSPFDNGLYSQTFIPSEADVNAWLFSGVEYSNGTLSVEVSSGEPDNGSIAVEVLGTIGMTPGGRVNRNGIGAVVTFKTNLGKLSILPISGGSSYASQDSLTAHFGLGAESHGQLKVLWPGGVRNQLRNVKAGERILFPEIPCDFEAQFSDREGYTICVNQALDRLLALGVIDLASRDRFLGSAFECENGPEALCLLDRFQVQVDWQDFEANTGSGQVVPFGAADAGLFQFFGTGLEMHVRVIDGCAYNGYYWVFAAASTNVEYTLRVTDTLGDSTKTYFNPLGTPATAITDTAAFASCSP